LMILAGKVVKPIDSRATFPARIIRSAHELWTQDFVGGPDDPCRETHRLKGDVPGKDHQVRPRNLASIFLLDRPQQTARLVEVHIVRPAIEGRKPLLPSSRSAAAITDSIRAGAVPRHADEQWPVVTEVGRPPFLRVGHDRLKVFHYGVQIKTLKFLRVIEI